MNFLSIGIFSLTVYQGRADCQTQQGLQLSKDSLSEEIL